MAGAIPLLSPLADGIRRFLATKRALGRKYLSEERELRLLDRFLVQQRIADLEHVTPGLLDTFLADRPRMRPRSFNHLLGVVRGLFHWLVAQGALQVSPLRTARRRVTAQRAPFLFDADQARRLLDAALALRDRSKGVGRGPTYRTIFALLYGLGLRVGEGCHLLCHDVDFDRGVLVVRGGKFGKSRLVPFGPRIASLLREHLKQRASAGSALDSEAPLFTFDGRRCVHPCTVSQDRLRRPGWRFDSPPPRPASLVRRRNAAALVPPGRGSGREAVPPVHLPRSRRPRLDGGVPDHYRGPAARGWPPL